MLLLLQVQTQAKLQRDAGGYLLAAPALRPLMSGWQHQQVKAITGLQLVPAVCLQSCTANRVTSSPPVHHTHQHQMERNAASQLTQQHTCALFSD